MISIIIKHIFRILYHSVAFKDMKAVSKKRTFWQRAALNDLNKQRCYDILLPDGDNNRENKFCAIKKNILLPGDDNNKKQILYN